MQRRRPKDLVLIDARSFAERLSTPTLITDAIGNLVYYNEAAEVLLGKSFAEAGEMPADTWHTLFTVRHVDGRPMPLEEMSFETWTTQFRPRHPNGTPMKTDEIPLAAAVLHRRPAHGALRILGSDGVDRTIEATGLPIFTGDKEPAGVMALFWPEE